MTVTVCPICLAPGLAVRGDGSLWRHGRNAQPCQGSGRAPLAARPVVYAGPDAAEMSCNTGLLLFAPETVLPRGGVVSNVPGREVRVRFDDGEVTSVDPDALTLISTAPAAQGDVQ